MKKQYNKALKTAEHNRTEVKDYPGRVAVARNCKKATRKAERRASKLQEKEPEKEPLYDDLDMEYHDDHIPQMVSFGCGFEDDIETPINATCHKCKELIQPGDCGMCIPFYDEDGFCSMLPFHLACSILGKYIK